MTACNAKRFLASSPLHNVNQNRLTIAKNGAGSNSLPTEKSSAEQSVATEQFKASTAAKATKMLIGESFISVDDETDNKRHYLKS